RGADDGHDEREQCSEPAETELAERADVERVRLACRIAHGALAQPFDSEAARSGPEQRPVEESLDRDAPVRVAVRAQRAEAGPRCAEGRAARHRAGLE